LPWDRESLKPEGLSYNYIAPAVRAPGTAHQEFCFFAESNKLLMRFAAFMKQSEVLRSRFCPCLGRIIDAED
jgi:hypothetical protein